MSKPVNAVHPLRGRYRCVARERDGVGVLHEQELLADDPMEAAETFARQCYEAWAFEDPPRYFPMRVEVSGPADVARYVVELDFEPAFRGRRST